MQYGEYEPLIDFDAHLFEEMGERIKPYVLTRRGFLDALYNRIHIVHFYPSSLHHARIFALRNQRDRYGRVKVALAINPEFSRDSQAQSLVHEMIHVDRNVWEKLEGVNCESEAFRQIVADEEELTEKAAQTFYDTHKSLGILALNHIWLRREELEVNPTKISTSD